MFGRKFVSSMNCWLLYVDRIINYYFEEEEEEVCKNVCLKAINKHLIFRVLMELSFTWFSQEN